MKYRNILKKRILAGLLAGAAACAAAPALAASGVVPNTQLPQGGNFVAGSGTIGAPSNGQMTITQNTQNGVIKWDSFNVGANATVNFEKGESYNGGDRFNTLNYVNQANGMSQIYGAISAAEGNIYIVNPAGVEISNSAQINVGSLYVSNRNMTDDVLKGVNDSTDITKLIQSQAMNENPDAVLMSLGNINATNVTFDGGRIVIDTERLKTGDEKMAAGNIKVNTTDAGSVVIGYDAYDKENETYAGANDGTAIVTVNDATWTKADGYMWVEDVEQLQKIDTNLGGNYALRNSIDATATQEWNNGAGFKPIGIDSTGKVIVENSKYGFHGNFDGLSYNIFNLNINRADAVNVGLFGVLHEAEINNVTFVGGAITGGNVVGSLAGAVLGNTHVNNVMNSASVTGGADVGGIIGYSGDEIDQVEDSDKPITPVSADAHFSNMVNTGTVVSSGTSDGNGGTISDAGGLIGNLYQGTLDGTSYNLGSVTGEGHNVGGLVGHAYASKLGDGTNLIYNRLDVTGAYNVGGIVGHTEGTTVQNAENSGTIAATGYDSNGKYSYHTAHYTGSDVVNGVKTENVNIANAGGIAGSASNVDGQESKIENAVNTGDVSSAVKSENGYDYYEAGNVGGIVGSAVDTDITNATNRENSILGAHNVGGVAGYFSGTGEIKTGTNDGGDILATGARHDGNFVKEWVRGGTTGGEEAIIGNMGGIVGYMDGDNVYITSSANRGTVHSQDILGSSVPLVSQAANAGGIVGKIDRSHTKSLEDLTAENSDVKAAVSNSYNTGDVRGYMAVGGVAGMMYNGEIDGSYNLGTVNTTRNKESFGQGDYFSVNMGGIVGDTTEGTDASALLYDVYNKGQIGDETFNYYARHVGGIVGRLSGTVEKAYNTGAIYNGYNVVGGIAGWMYKGSITNAFNTGNITVVNNENGKAGIQAGGIVGGATTGAVTISNVYNLGTIRGFQEHGANGYAVGGIVGAFIGNGTQQSISNAYTTGNLYLNVSGDSSKVGLGSIYGTNRNYSQHITTTNTYYISPDAGLPFYDLANELDGGVRADNSNHNIAFAEKDKVESYQYDEEGHHYSLGFSSQDGGNVIETGEDWRIYEGSTPILNAFLPNTEDYFAGEKEGITPDLSGIGSIQYGTAYDPLLTIINANGGKANLEFNWIELGANNAAGIAVYGAGLTLNDFKATGGSGYYAGLLYADGALSVNADGDALFGSAAELYGSSVTIDAKGDVTIYGDVTATGNIQDGTSWDEDAKKYTGTLSEDENNGKINISGGSVDIYGQLTSAKKDGEPVRVPGINGMAEGWDPSAITDEDGKPIENAHENPNIAMSDIGDRFGYTTSGSAVDGDITITATDASDGHVNVYYGNQEEGFIDAAGSLYVEAKGDIYMDSDLKVGGGLTLTSPGEMVLDLTNIGQVQADKGLVTDALTGLHDFMHQFETGGNTISFQTNTSDGTAADAKLTVDMWEDGAYDLTKYDTNGHTFKDELDQLNFTVQGDEAASAAKYTYIWVSTGEQLAGIQQAADTNPDFLGYNFALKNDIDASQVQGYEAIGGGGEYKGTFDGRDNRIIGLDVSGDNAGIFSTIGKDGKVEDLRVYSGTFSGTNNAGAVAGVNNGAISNVTAFGNVVSAEGSSNSTELKKDDGSTVHVGAAGGVAGVNTGTIDNVTVSGTATAADGEEGNTALSAAGGIVGINMGDTAKISNSSSNSAVNASAESTYALGGAAGVNSGTLENVDSLGVTTGIYKVQTGGILYAEYSDNVGGIAGTNSGSISNAYNESIVSGRDNVGGIIGTNEAGTTVENVSNAASVTGEAGTNGTSDYVGGLAGTNSGTITNGRNNGTITGNQYVGGLVGNNASADSKLENLVNDEAAAITGDNFVGGIAGSNAGTITAIDQQLVNRGSITGQTYVGGVAGVNTETGVIANTISSIALHVKTPYSDDSDDSNDPKYFGGVVGQNQGTIQGATNESSVDVAADGASMVGGIIGENTETGKLEGTIANKGVVSGKSDVGGIIGSNKNDDILNNSAGADRLIVSNSGLVKAEDGGAAGIFYKNTGAINNADLVNTGMVIGGSSKDSVTGGLFGKNSGEISNSTLTNNGTVYGGGTVGGLIGENKGNISHSSLINSTDGEVIGIQNVGGLIGVNTGDITGGRDGNDGYYKYQIYNNGTITAGTWTDTNGDGMIDEGEITAGAAGNDIAGLFGSNSGKVTAAYNTGAVVAENSTNVGGIAGTNSGTLDQVFNTVMTGVNENGETQYGSITGNSNVGGLVGSNTADGKISNAYNTTGVEGSNTTGSLVGANDGTVSNVYGSGADKLIGSGTGNTSNMYDLAGEGIWDKADSYTGFDFNDTWKIYEGSTNPLLKVFLTKVTISGDTDLGLVYNGKDQDIDLDDFTSHSGIFAADDFAAYENNNSLIQNTDFEHKNAGSYSDWLYSGQIAAGTGEDGFNPNNLGYDIDFTQDIDKAQITISLDEIHRDYGSSVIKNGGDYGFTVGNADKDAGLTEEMQEELAGITMNRDSVQDGAVSDLADGKTATNNAGTYEWSAEFSLKDSLANNYELVSAEGTADSKVTVSENKSIVDKVQLTIDLNDVNRVYGDTAITNGSYGIENVTGLVNGDEAQKDSLTLADNADIKDGALSEDKTKTNDVKDGGYSWNVSGEDDVGKAQNFTGIDNLATNYDITIKDGSSMVDQKEISVGDLGASIVYGNQDGKGLVIHGDLGLTGIVYNDDVSLSGDASYTTGGSYDTNKGGCGTADVGTYEDSLFVDGLMLSGEKKGNYKLVTGGAVGDIEVTKADLTITVDKAETTYGTAFDSSKYGYTLGGIVNGDTEDALKGDIGNVTYTNSAAKDGTNGVWTDDAGTHKGAVGIDMDTLGELSNYEIITVTKGDAVVNRKEISIGAGSHDIYVGENEPTYTGTDIQGQLVNGDTISDDAYQYGPETSVDTSVTGEHTIGIHFGGSYLNASGQSAWDAVMNGLFQNYKVTFTPGKLTISDMPVDRPSEGEHWNFLFDDNPWDRNRDFRERKAEVHFVAGGMTL